MSDQGAGTSAGGAIEANLQSAAEEIDDLEGSAVDDGNDLPVTNPYPVPAGQPEPITPTLIQPKDVTYEQLGSAARYEYASAYSVAHFIYEAAAATESILTALPEEATLRQIQECRSGVVALRSYLVDTFFLLSERLDYHKTVVSEGPTVAAAIYNQVTAKAHQPALQSSIFRGALATYQLKVANARVALEVGRNARDGRSPGRTGDATTSSSGRNPPARPSTENRRKPTAPAPSSSATGKPGNSWKGKAKDTSNEPERARSTSRRRGANDA
jgi:hypothetical protein